MRSTIYCGHVLDVLAQMPERSVHCIVTSPPYWGLRVYAGEPMIWDGDPTSRHEWGQDAGYTGHRGNRGQVAQTKWPAQQDYPQITQTSRSAVCIHCGAWRGQLGHEPVPELYVAHLVAVFRALRRVLRDDGIVHLNVGDSWAADNRGGGQTGGEHAAALHGDTGIGRARRYSGLKSKDLVGIPWQLAFALREDGWYLRSDIIWAKGVSGQQETGDQVVAAMDAAGCSPEQMVEVLTRLDLYHGNSMPGSQRDRPTGSHEYVFLLSKRECYYYDAEAAAEPVSDPAGPRPHGGGGRIMVWSDGPRYGGRPKDRADGAVTPAASRAGSGRGGQSGRFLLAVIPERISRRSRGNWQR